MKNSQFEAVLVGHLTELAHGFEELELVHGFSSTMVGAENLPQDSLCRAGPSARPEAIAFGARHGGEYFRCTGPNAWVFDRHSADIMARLLRASQKALSACQVGGGGPDAR